MKDVHLPTMGGTVFSDEARGLHSESGCSTCVVCTWNYQGAWATTWFTINIDTGDLDRARAATSLYSTVCMSIIRTPVSCPTQSGRQYCAIQLLSQESLTPTVAKSKPYNVDPILQLGNLEVQRVARWMESPFWGPCLGPGAM